jgi:hypothetical protein
MIATRCLVSGLRLLHNGSGFDAFEKRLALRVVHCDA